ncbi:MAG: transposase [Anaerolineae bacterium]|nr:transposase [Anaerolineae bacterium]
MSKRKRYPTDLTDTQWVRIEPHLPRRTSPRGRKRIHSPREILNAILYALRTGCPWRMLPHDFLAWKTAYHSFRRWRMDGTWERLNAVLFKAVCEAQGDAPEPRG